MLTPEQIDAISRQVVMPLVLLLNYTLLLYVATFYWTRRHEWRIQLLLLVAFLGVLCLVPFANPDNKIVGHLNEISESCSVLTFLIQITVIGYDLNKKIKFKTVLYLTYVAESLILADLAMVVLSFASIFDHGLLTPRQEQIILNVCENVTLAFIFVFRYYYIIASLGWRDLWTKRKLEICCYLLFATHEVPFAFLGDHDIWTSTVPQRLWNRVTLASCLWVTARAKLRKESSGSYRAGMNKSKPSSAAVLLVNKQPSLSTASKSQLSKKYVLPAGNGDKA